MYLYKIYIYTYILYTLFKVIFFLGTLQVFTTDRQINYESFITLFPRKQKLILQQVAVTVEPAIKQIL